VSIQIGYQPAGPCTQGPQPGAIALMAWWLTGFADRGAVNSGIFNCRVIAGSTVRSLHGEGRAADLGVRPNGADYGHDVASLLLANSAEIGIQCIIWSRRIWSGARPFEGFRAYGGTNPHVDHLHVELTWPAARLLTQARIVEILGGVAPQRVLRLASPRMRGEDVRSVQRALAAHFPSLNLDLDGVFGPRTEAAVRQFQASAGIGVDGEVGPITRRALGLG
jgi:Putative peptidoglycan binding domain